MHSKSDNIKIMMKQMKFELFDSLEKRYQNSLESMKGSEFVFDYIHLLYYYAIK